MWPNVCLNSHLSSLKEVVGREEKNGQLEILDPFPHSSQYGLAFWELWNPSENFFRKMHLNM